MIKIIGFFLIIEGSTSLILPQDKQIPWQVSRIIRILIGIYLLCY